MIAPSQDPLELGSVLGGSYEILRVIGRGGMGVVYEARHTRLPQRLAIKVIRGNADRQSIERFRREAEIASSLGHPNIMRVFDFNETPDGTPYMVMDFLEGTDVERAIASEGPFDTDRAIGICRQVGSALMAAHAGGIVHRDLKPSNIFLTMSEFDGAVTEHVTVLDFGISKVQDSSTVVTQTAAIIGTPQFMAPEQAMGQHDQITPKTDQFSLATVVYVMLTGALPFSGQRLHEIVYKICHTEPVSLDTRLPKLDPKIVAAVGRAMAKEPEGRFATLGEFITEISGRPVAVLPREKLRSRPEPISGGDLGIQNTMLSHEKISTAATMASMQDGGAIPSPTDQAAVAPGGPTAVETGATVAAAVSTEPGEPPPKHSGAETLRPTFDARYHGRGGPTREAGDPEPKTMSRRWPAVMVPIVLVAGGVLGVAVWAWPEPAASPEVPAPAVVAMDAAMADASDASARDVPTAASKTDAPPDAGTEPGPPDAGVKRRTVSADPSNRQPEPVATKSPKLAAARKALEQGRFARARQLADTAYRESKSRDVFAIKVMAYCGEGNFGTAVDWFARVPRKRRGEVVRFCKKHEIDLR